MEEATYTYGGAAKILDIPESKLRYWRRSGSSVPRAAAAASRSTPFRTWCVKAAKELVERGFKAGRDRKALDAVRSTAAARRSPARLHPRRLRWHARWWSSTSESAYEPTGQKVFDFALEDLAKKSARPGVLGTLASRPATEAPPNATPLPSPSIVALGAVSHGVTRSPAPTTGSPRARAPRSSAAPSRGRAEDCYRQALTLDPGLAAARTNLGSLAYRRETSARRARPTRRRLLSIPISRKPGSTWRIWCWRPGDLELAVAELRRVFQGSPDFADAHYNLAVALERLGGRSQARSHLERYLALEPATTAWAAEARALISRLDA